MHRSSQQKSSQPQFYAPHLEQSFEQTEIHRIITTALQEDVGTGDITSLSTMPADYMGVAKFLAKEDGVLSGLDIAVMVFAQVDRTVQVQFSMKDGDYVKKGVQFGTVTGPVRSILTGERLALNLLQRMSGVATATSQLISRIPSTSQTRILDTRKTMPGLRILDKMAVRHGKGLNHRYALYDMVLIKDNHVDAAGGVQQALQNVRSYLESKKSWGKIQIELETRTLKEVQEAMNILSRDKDAFHRIMLDNMVKVSRDVATGMVTNVDTSLLQQALAIIQGRVATEASGNINLETIAQIAATNVDYVSIGAITHSVSAMDISLKIVEMKKRGSHSSMKSKL